MLRSAALSGLLSLACQTEAADFSVQDISAQEWCLSATSPWVSKHVLPQCRRHAPGTLRVTVTPASGELPLSCRDNGSGGNICSYSANIYLAAYYRGSWFEKIDYRWEPVALAQLKPKTTWTSWGDGSGSTTYDFQVGTIDLSTSRELPPPEGFEVYMAVSPVGSTTFNPNLIAKIYPLPSPSP